MSVDPEKVTKKLDEVHEDVKDIKGEFKALHTRMDRETRERGWSLVGLGQAIRNLEERIVALFRK